jgi:bacteriorhodopsin
VLPAGASISDLSVTQFDLIYNFLSMVTAAMGASTIFFFFQFTIIDKAFKNALLVSSMVTLIACYHYFRIFGSFNECYYVLDNVVYASGAPFNDAYRYVDWLLTVPLLLMELILVMQLDADETAKQCLKLGSLAALMVVLGYPGEVTDNMNTRWMFWGLAMLPFIVIVYSLFFGLKESVDKQPANARDLVAASVWITSLSWCTYPIVYIFPMIGFTGASAQTAIQVGYSVADVIAKPILGLVVWRIAVAKSQ